MLFYNKLNELKDTKVSILLDLNKCSLFKESYSGIIKEIGDDYIILDTNNSNFFIKSLLLRKDLIVSIWKLK